MDQCRVCSYAKLYRSVMVKRELSQKVRLSIYQSIYIPTLTYGHELWGVNERMRLQIQAAECLGSALERLRGSEIQEGLKVDPLLLCIKTSQLRWFWHVSRMPPRQEVKSGGGGMGKGGLSSSVRTAAPTRSLR